MQTSEELKVGQSDENIITIDKVFRDGSSTVSFIGRNDSIIKLALETLGNGLRGDVLILGSGCYEPWTTAGQEALQNTKVNVVCVDRNEELTAINRHIQQIGSVQIGEISPLAGNPVFGAERHGDANDLLREAKIRGVDISNDSVSISSDNRMKVQVEPASNVFAFVETQPPERYSLIFSGNLENNLIYQDGYTFDQAVRYHKNILALLKHRGIYVFTSNEVFFNNVRPRSTHSILSVVRESEMDILFKGTQYTHFLERDGKLVMTENCAIFTSKPGEYSHFPDYQQAILAIRKRMKDYTPDLHVIEAEGNLEELERNIEIGQTNLVLLKIGDKKYHWFNAAGGYKDVFAGLASQGDGYYPELFISISESNVV